MTSQFPDDTTIEYSSPPEQRAEGTLNPQPGMIMDGDLDAGTERSGSSRTVVVLVAALAVALIAVAVGVALYVLVSRGATPAPDAAPIAEVTRAAGGGPGVEEQYSGPTGAAMYDKYVAMIDDESIFLIIPQTDEGWAYFSAFLYKIADYKAAESFGELSLEQGQEMLALEARFLALEDLQMTVDITRSDGTHFLHDGKPPAPADATASPTVTPSPSP